MTTLDFTRATYTLAAHYPHQWPPDVGAEVAFVGRSNVGKSSAINAITHRRRLARVSKTPGRTRQIVFFDLDADHRLVDLPGYGYANVPRDLRRHWERFIADYLTRRHCLKALVLPMDIRHPLTDLDRSMLACCGDVGLPVHVLLTKADKYKRGRAAAALERVRAALKERPETTVQLFSALNRQGVEEAGEVVSGFLLGQAAPPRPPVTS